jgi:anaerobic magnesium-protoporphyrin IX monomethyl ester cyclase
LFKKTGSGKRIERVLLLNPPMNLAEIGGNLADFMSISAPAGLCYIAALLRQEGYQVSILDAQAEWLDTDTTVQRIVGYSPDIIGISFMTSGVTSAYKVAQLLKKAIPEVPLVAGGPHATAIPERTLDEFPYFDILVIGEGEITFKEIIEALVEGADLRKVKGLAFKEKGEIVITPPRERIKNLDDLPLPAYDLLPELKTHYWPLFNNIQGYPAFSLIASRGCPYQCKFCDRAVFGNTLIQHSPEYMVALIEKLVKEHGIRYLVFDDDNLLLDKKQLFGMLDLLEKKKIKVPFTCESRVDTVDEERLRRLKAGGCKQILYGMESGSPRILELMGKGITVDKIRHAVDLTRKFGITTYGYFILGYPGENEESMQETVDFIKDLKLFDIGAQPFVPFPGSEAYQTAREYGEYDEDWEKVGSFTQIVYVSHGLSKEKIRQYLNKCYNACYLNLRGLLTLYKRVHSFKHSKILVKFLLQGSRKFF